ncbi:MAG: hypothetical protein ACIALR_09080, partial [Blastopirellula sp. JB062]
NLLMTFSTQNLVALIAVFAFAVSSATQVAEAGGCHSRGGYRGGYSAPNHYRSRYQPQYRQPVSVARPAPQPAPQPQGAPQETPQQAFASEQPQASIPQPQGQAPTGQPSSSNASTPNAESSALAALGGFAPPQAEAPQSPGSENAPLPAHVGRWSAKLANGATIQLDLNANGSFNWSAVNKNGASSSFQGTYEIADGSLTLIRSSDNQKLAGSLQTSGNDAFSFQLADQQAAKLDFVRA